MVSLALPVMMISPVAGLMRPRSPVSLKKVIGMCKSRIEDDCVWQI
jgi:hypothetical protein